VDFLFHILMPLLIAFLLWAAYALVRRTKERRAAWESGLTAQAGVVRAWVTTQMVNNVLRRTQWHEYEFTTADGRAVRFKESGGPTGRAEGDRTLVYYVHDDPEKATAGEPSPGKDTAGAVIGVGIMVVGVVILTRVMFQYG
jgi:hypothetical protein